MKKLIAAALFIIASVLTAEAQIVNSLPFNLQNNTTADATQVMADFNQIVNNVNSNAAKNGANSDITSLLGLTTPLVYTAGGTSAYIGGTSTGTANAQVVASPTPNGFSLVAGKRILFTAGATNTTTMTLNVNSLGAIEVYKLTPKGSAALQGNEVRSGSLVEAVYDGTQYTLLTNSSVLLGPTATIASATTTDLGTVASHIAAMSGSATVTSFGSTASTTYPIYIVRSTGTATLTYNATSMILPGSADIVTASGDVFIAEYLGSGNWRVISYQPISGSSVVATTPLCGATGLSITNNASNLDTHVDVSADSVVMLNSSGVAKTASSVSVTINSTTTGVANGIEAARAASTWYHLYLINNGTTTAGFASTSATAPTLPSGYTYKCRLGAIPTDGTGNKYFYRVTQLGNWTTYKATKTTNTTQCFLIDSGAVGTYSTGTPVWKPSTVSGNGFAIPPTATQYQVQITGSYNAGALSSVMAAPNNAYMGRATVSPAPLNIDQGPSNLSFYIRDIFQVEATTQINWASSAAGGAVLVCGWQDKVLAN